MPEFVSTKSHSSQDSKYHIFRFGFQKIFRRAVATIFKALASSLPCCKVFDSGRKAARVDLNKRAGHAMHDEWTKEMIGNRK